MFSPDTILNEIFNINTEKQFNKLSLLIFEYQFKYNKVYRSYVNKLNINTSKIKHYKDIPSLPIDFFKTHKIITGNKTIQTTFRSSGTTGMTTSEHHIITIPTPFCCITPS